VRRPSQKAILFFLLALGAGYAISIGIMVGLLNTEMRLYGFANVSLIAFLIAFILLVWFDKPFELKLFDWPEEKPKTEEKQAVDDSQPQAPGEGPSAPIGQVPSGSMFPHERPTEHWEADFADPKEVYEGTALPIWLLAGWAIFIIWAVIYLVSGLPTALQ
jgi:hypothetical protein